MPANRGFLMTTPKMEDPGFVDRRRAPSTVAQATMKKLLLFFALFASPALAQAPQNFGTVNGSVVIATGNTFQTVLAANNKRRSLTIVNNNASDSCWITFGSFGGTTITAGNATKGRSILLLAGGSFTRYYPYIPSDEIEATCVTTSDTLYVDLQ